MSTIYSPFAPTSFECKDHTIGLGRLAFPALDIGHSLTANPFRRIARDLGRAGTVVIQRDALRSLISIVDCVYLFLGYSRPDAAQLIGNHKFKDVLELVEGFFYAINVCGN